MLRRNEPRPLYNRGRRAPGQAVLVCCDYATCLSCLPDRSSSTRAGAARWHVFFAQLHGARAGRPDHRAGELASVPAAGSTL